MNRNRKAANTPSMAQCETYVVCGHVQTALAAHTPTAVHSLGTPAALTCRCCTRTSRREQTGPLQRQPAQSLQGLCHMPTARRHMCRVQTHQCPGRHPACALCLPVQPTVKGWWRPSGSPRRCHLCAWQPEVRTEEGTHARQCCTYLSLERTSHSCH